MSERKKVFDYKGCRPYKWETFNFDMSFPRLWNAACKILEKSSGLSNFSCWSSIKDSSDPMRIFCKVLSDSDSKSVIYKSIKGVKIKVANYHLHYSLKNPPSSCLLQRIYWQKKSHEQYKTCSLYSSKTVTEKLNREVEVDSELAKSNNSSKQRAYKPRS